MNLGRKHKTILLSTDQLEAIRTAIQQSVPDVELTPPEDSHDDGPRHLTNEEFVALSMASMSMEPTSEAAYRAALAHIDSCPDCADEWERLRALGAIWQDETTVARLTARRQAVLKHQRYRPDAARRVPLTALLPAQGVRAEQAFPDPDAISFPIYLEETVVTGLIGTVKRRNREYYALIIPTDAASATLFGERSVLITISDETSAQPILRREIAIDVAVLLGTNLLLSSESAIQADMAPEEK